MLRYQAEVQVGGKLAQIGSRMISGVAQRMANEFFSAFAKQLELPTDLETPLEKQTKLSDSNNVNVSISRRSIAPAYWIAGVIVVTGLLWWLYA